MLHVGVVTIFPDMFSALTDFGITGRAVSKGLLKLSLFNPREFAQDNHRSVDDKPYGGGPGMVMMYQPVADAIHSARQELNKAKVVYLSPQGVPLQQSSLNVASSGNLELILLAGRYEGIDERVIDRLVDEEWSIGDYVISGGELAAMVVIDAMTRTVPGVVGHEDSVAEDSFSSGLLDYPHYTRPDIVDGMEVPAELLGGDHERIRRWRLQQALGRTWLRRPELIEKLELSDEERALLKAFIDKHKVLD